ncbi:MAG: sel1 repeat family protein [Deltaproteobacteria bacterium]|nr:sel1 repeat family protein [Deltaproteobacteria bacterium]
MIRNIPALCLVLALACLFPVTGFRAYAADGPPPAVERSPEELALRKAAEEGDPTAQYELGLALVRPIPPQFGPVKEGAEAVEWLEKSAAQGNADAAFLLGYIHQYAVGVTKDIGKAVTWMNKASDAGNTAAMVTLAAIYKVGDGVMRDKVKARDLYARAAEKGNNNARTALATMYMDGDGVHRDGKLASAWFRRAIKDGHAPAMLGLGKLHAANDLGMLNGPKALYWTHQAVVHGYPPAVYAMGLLYRDGVGTVQPDAYMAYLWLRLAHELSALANATAKPEGGTIPYWLENAERVLTVEQRKKAEAEIAGWLRNGPPAAPAGEPE